MDDLTGRVLQSPHGHCLLFGPVGSGKSFALQALRERARQARWTVVSVCSPADAAAILGAVPAASARGERVLVTVDPCRGEIAFGATMRQLTDADPKVTFVLATRSPPPPGWPVRDSIRAIEVAPLTDDAAGTLVRATRLVPDAIASRVVPSAHGSPLELLLCARASHEEPGSDLSYVTMRPQLVSWLLRRTGVSELERSARELLELASLIRVLTPDLAAAVFPERGEDECHRWLEASGLAVPAAGGMTLVDVVRRAVRADLHHSAPGREHRLRRLLADLVLERGLRGDANASVDLAELSHSSRLRDIYGWDLPPGYGVRAARPSDRTALADGFARAGVGHRWPTVERFVDQAPETVLVVADRADRPLGATVAITPGRAPGCAESDPVTGPLLSHLASTSVDLANVLVWGPGGVFGGASAGRRGQLQAALNLGVVTRCGLENPQRLYVATDGDGSRSAFVRALGARAVRLRGQDAPSATGGWWAAEFGRRGLLGAQHDLITYELGLGRSPFAQPAPAAIDKASVRAALRDYQRPQLLATNPLGGELPGAQRIDSIRTQIDDAIEREFGSSAVDRELREILIEAYLSPTALHDAAVLRLGLSRTTYFRRLRLAVDRVVAAICGG